MRNPRRAALAPRRGRRANAVPGMQHRALAPKKGYCANSSERVPSPEFLRPGPGRDPGSFGFRLDPPRRSRSASALSALRQDADPATMKAKPARKTSPTNQHGSTIRRLHAAVDDAGIRQPEQHASLDRGEPRPRRHADRNTDSVPTRVVSVKFRKLMVVTQLTRSTLFRRPSCEKVAPAGQFEAAGGVAVPCRHDGSAEHSLPGSAERQLRLRGSHRPERLFPDGA